MTLMRTTSKHQTSKLTIPFVNSEGETILPEPTLDHKGAWLTHASDCKECRTALVEDKEITCLIGLNLKTLAGE